jgi:hypothetical protein
MKRGPLVVAAFAVLQVVITSACEHPPDNVCPSVVSARVDSISGRRISWGQPKQVATSALLGAVADCIPVHTVGKDGGAVVTTYRIPVTLRVAGFVVDSAQYAIAASRGGLHASIIIEALGRTGAVLESATIPYKFVDAHVIFPESGAIENISADEIGRLASIRAAWVYER